MNQLQISNNINIIDIKDRDDVDLLSLDSNCSKMKHIYPGNFE